MSWDSAVVWFRRDLRVADQPALADAVRAARRVVCLFVVDEQLTQVSPARTWFLGGALRSLDDALRARGGALRIEAGAADTVVPAVAAEVGAEVVLASRDVTPRSHRRDLAVAAALERDGRQLLLRAGLLLAEPESVLTAAGTPYGVFTPFWRALQQAPRRTPLPAPDRIPGPDAGTSALQGASLAPEAAPLPGLPAPGEAAAHDRLRHWLVAGLAAYGDTRDVLSGEGTSHLGADLHLGVLSPRQVEAAVAESGVEGTAFLRQLAWREFYHHLMFHRRAEPDGAATAPLMAAFRRETEDPGAVAAWRAGQTGIPTVDAAMRQLAATGWLSNRARLIVASFLTRHLLMDYRVGARHFMHHLIDGDVANNIGGWQWTAGVGADAQPWFRIFNPVRQGQRFDPEGTWVRRWVPELVPVADRYIHAPWEMPAADAAAAGVRLGGDYPRPIVDLHEARERALAAFKAATSTS